MVTAFGLLVILFEIVLGMFFLHKDRDLYQNKVKDYPYLYYLFQQNDDTNEYGFKTQYSAEKPGGVYRIVLIGGSVARGREPENSIATYLEKELKSVNEKLKFEVVNAGISAFVIEQEFLLIQLVLQDFQPDLIISLDGYNDLLTYKLNLHDKPSFRLPPHNWQVFRVIAENENQQKFLSRFIYFFRNITRMFDYFNRIGKQKSLDLMKISADELKQVNDTYWKIVADTRDFCEVKGIDYLHFLQPVKFYSFPGADYPENKYEDLLSRLYSLFDSSARLNQFAHSLTPVLDENEDLYLDQCHVKNTGHALLAAEMAVQINNRVLRKVNVAESDTIFDSGNFFETE